MLGEALPEIYRQVHPLTVLFLDLIPAEGDDTRRTLQKTRYETASRATSLTRLSQQDLHKDVIFIHDLVEAIVPPVNFMESMIVNISNDHLERKKKCEVGTFDNLFHVKLNKHVLWRCVLGER